MFLHPIETLLILVSSPHQINLQFSKTFDFMQVEAPMTIQKTYSKNRNVEQLRRRRKTVIVARKKGKSQGKAKQRK